MSITFQIDNEEHYLKVIAEGKDDHLNELKKYSEAVISEAIKHQCKKIFCDERNLDYSISVIDTYQLAEDASKHASDLAKLVIVCNKKHLNDGKFYENVATNRGLNILVTDNYEEAMQWIKD